MKITKDTQTVWKLENGHTIIGIGRRSKLGGYFVRNDYGIVEYSRDEMIEVYRLTDKQFNNIEKSGI